MRDLIIISGGPAAAATAVYALGKQLDSWYSLPKLSKAGRTQQLAAQSEVEYLPGAELL